MNIKQHGICYTPLWELDVPCDCGAILTLQTADDLFIHPYAKIDDCYVYYTYHCICPECGKNIIVDEQQISPDVKKFVRKIN